MAAELENYRNFEYSYLRADEEKVHPNNEAFFGPYASVEEAYNAIYNELEDAIPLGLKFGVDEGNGKFREFCFKNGTDMNGIVELFTITAEFASDKEYDDVVI